MKATEREAIEARKRYYREWRAKNRDKVKRSNANYWRRRAEREKAENAAEQCSVSQN